MNISKCPLQQQQQQQQIIGSFYNCCFYRNTQQPVVRPHPALRVKTDVANLLNKISMSNIFVYYTGLLLWIPFFYLFILLEEMGFKEGVSKSTGNTQRRFMKEMLIMPQQVRTSNFYTSAFIRTCYTPWCWRRLSEWFAKKQAACGSRNAPFNRKNLQPETRPAPLVTWESWKYSSQLEQYKCHWRITHPIVHSFVVYSKMMSLTF